MILDLASSGSNPAILYAILKSDYATIQLIKHYHLKTEHLSIIT